MKKEYIKYGLFFGGVAGILEATLGYVLHLLPSGVSGSIMYPILFLTSVLAYKTSKSIKSVYLMTCVASIIKLTNLMLPGQVIKVVNPSLAILFEGISVALVIKYAFDHKENLSFAPVLAGSLGWRLMFLMTAVIESGFGIQVRMLASPVAMIKYVSFGLINAVIIFGAVKVIQKLNKNVMRFNIKTSHFSAVCMIALAICMELVLA